MIKNNNYNNNNDTGPITNTNITTSVAINTNILETIPLLLTLLKDNTKIKVKTNNSIIVIMRIMTL